MQSEIEVGDMTKVSYHDLSRLSFDTQNKLLVCNVVLMHKKCDETH